MVEKIALTEKELDEILKVSSPAWKIKHNEKGMPYIERIKHAHSFMGGIDFVQQVAQLAEENNHHPDIMIQYKRISVRYWTHTASGVTQADVQMAKKVDALF